MKPAPFEYFAPASLAEALDLLSEYGMEGKVLAGGQSLVPSMNFRLAQPGILIDLNGVSELFGVRETPGRMLHIGAMTRQRDVERSPLVAERAPLIHEAMPFIAHPQIRNRGTVGGSMAHADPAAELPALAVALRCSFLLRGSRGERTIPAAEFFQGLFTTALEPDELLAEIIVPALPESTGTAFEEVARRHGDYALAGAASVVTLAADGSVDAARIVLFSVSDIPVECVSAADMLAGQAPTEDAITAAAESAAADIDPPSDIHATSAYRRHIAKVLARKTLLRAVARAREA